VVNLGNYSITLKGNDIIGGVLDLSTAREYRPVAGSRRGEYTAWILTIVVLATGLLLPEQLDALQLASWFLTGLFGLAGALISFGNWVGRHTVLRLDEDGLAFSNGLRRVRMAWKMVEALRVQPGPLGKQVEVFGEQASFRLRTSGELTWQGEVRDRIGFERGEEIMDIIIAMTELEMTDRSADSSYYYARR